MRHEGPYLGNILWLLGQSRKNKIQISAGGVSAITPVIIDGDSAFNEIKVLIEGSHIHPITLKGTSHANRVELHASLVNGGPAASFASQSHNNLIHSSLITSISGVAVTVTNDGSGNLVKSSYPNSINN